MIAPFISLDAEVALFPAWEDGMPMTGPSPHRDSVAPYLHCHTTIRWARSTVRRESPFGDHRRVGAMRADEISISVAQPEGAVTDGVGHAYRLPNLSGRYCLVVVLWSQEEKQWQRWQFFHVRLASDAFDAGDGSQAASRPFDFIAEHVEFDAYEGEPPSCQPEVLGRVEFRCGPLTVPCMTYDMLTNVWRMTSYADTGIEIEQGGVMTYLPYLMWDEPLVSHQSQNPNVSTFSLLQPRTELRSPVPAPHQGIDPSPYLGVLWQRRLFFSVQRQSGVKNQILLHAGISLEANGSPEPLEKLDQDELLHESVAVFRVLDRVYATVGHDRIAVPAVHYDQRPLSTNYFFQLGDTILDDQGWWNLAEPVLVANPS